MKNPSPTVVANSAALGAAIELAVLAALFVTLPLSPIAISLLSGDWGYVARYVTTLRRSVDMLKAMRRLGVIQRNLPAGLDTRDTGHEQITGQCTHCGRCCIDQKCVFLGFDAVGQSSCQIYGNWYWRRTNCGKYPQSGRDIQVYECPSYSAMPVRVIRLQRVKADTAPFT